MNNKKLMNEILFVRFVRIVVVAHILYIIYNQLYIFYLPIKYNMWYPLHFFIIDVVIATLLSILCILILLKVKNLCEDKIFWNRFLIGDIKLFDDSLEDD
jgi:hypothetical protein